MTRKPWKLEQYTTAEIAAADLERVAAKLRDAATDYPLVKWSVHFSFWNPRWEDPAMTPTGQQAKNDVLS